MNKDSDSFGNYQVPLSQQYDIRTAAAWILGHSKNSSDFVLPESLASKTADECSEQELLQIVCIGKAAGLKLYPFKSGTQVLARTKRTLGFLHSVYFETLLDVGSGRGVFLIPFMKAFEWVKVTSIDILEHRVEFLNELASGGFSQLTAIKADICNQPFPDNSFDVITMLEVLEHIPDVQSAICSALRMAKHYVVVSVPSKEDDNPEHLHLLTKEELTRMFNAAGCNRLHFDAVEGHTFLVAATDFKEEE